MPIPFILAGLGAAAGILGVGGHLSAQETNEKARRLSEDAQELYDDARASLESAQRVTETSLLKLGYSKKNVMETSIKQFLKSYERIKHINFRESDGINEISKFVIDQQKVIELREMTNIYQSTFSSGAAGAATGAVVALAASGSLPVITGTLSAAGTALMAGEVGMAAGMAGTALSFGAMMTPLTAIAAPALLFTGISSSIKADENLEKARAMYAEAEAKAEKMKISETMCVAITRRSNMFDGLLGELNGMFSECARLMDGVTKKKTGLFHRKKIDANDFTEEELKLIAVTRALAGAVKSIIDTPILSKEGELSDEAENMYEETVKRLPDFKNEMQKVESYHIKVKTKAATVNKNSTESIDVSCMPDIIRNIIALIIALIASRIVRNFISDTYVCSSFAFVITTLLIMTGDTTSGLFKFVKYIVSIVFALNFCILLYFNGETLTSMKFFLWVDIPLVIVFFILLGLAIPNDNRTCGNLRKMLQSIFSCLFCFVMALLLFALLKGLFKIPFSYSIIITEILFAPCVLISVIDTQQAYLKSRGTIGYFTIVFFTILVIAGVVYNNRKRVDFTLEDQKTNTSKILYGEQYKTDNEKKNNFTNENGVVYNSNVKNEDNYTYILPESSTKYLSKEDLDGLDKSILRLARNEIFARHGRLFQTEDLNEYFSNQSWYHGYLSQEEFDDSVLNEYEKANLELIKTAEGIEALSNQESAFSVTDIPEKELILPESSHKYLNFDDLAGLDQKDLRLARNEIYAKHGRKFETEDLNQYFTSKSWYQGYLSQEEFDDSVLNEYEKANLELIKAVEGIETPSNQGWVGNYISEDDQTIGISSADDTGVLLTFVGYSEEGWYTRAELLPYTNNQKNQVSYKNYYEGQLIQETFYTLIDEGIKVEVQPAGGWQEGIYFRQ
ncbi:MAG: YARHG domain-containing protein [Lachnospiraceae bacterium]|nr:YARHG domain-containing protein [Lachnospiraceae bacterium]